MHVLEQALCTMGCLQTVEQGGTWFQEATADDAISCPTSRLKRDFKYQCFQTLIKGVSQQSAFGLTSIISHSETEGQQHLVANKTFLGMCLKLASQVRSCGHAGHPQSAWHAGEPEHAGGVLCCRQACADAEGEESSWAKAVQKPQVKQTGLLEA